MKLKFIIFNCNDFCFSISFWRAICFSPHVMDFYTIFFLNTIYALISYIIVFILMDKKNKFFLKENTNKNKNKKSYENISRVSTFNEFLLKIWNYFQLNERKHYSTIFSAEIQVNNYVIMYEYMYVCMYSNVIWELKLN